MSEFQILNIYRLKDNRLFLCMSVEPTFEPTTCKTKIAFVCGLVGHETTRECLDSICSNVYDGSTIVQCEFKYSKYDYLRIPIESENISEAILVDNLDDYSEFEVLSRIERQRYFDTVELIGGKPTEENPLPEGAVYLTHNSSYFICLEVNGHEYYGYSILVDDPLGLTVKASYYYSDDNLNQINKNWKFVTMLDAETFSRLKNLHRFSAHPTMRKEREQFDSIISQQEAK